MADGATASPARAVALRFVVLIGTVSLFADMTYEGARSLNGSFLALLGASGAVVGFVAGFGELVGYGLRFASGRWADRSHAYWPLAFLGYGVNLFAVPLLAFAHGWPMAAALIVAERAGKAIRTPSRDAMLSHASHTVGRGFTFGLHEAMDSTGATLGPLLLALALYLRHDLRLGYALLVVPAVLALLVLNLARLRNPHPRDLEPVAKTAHVAGLSRRYALLVTGACFLGAGMTDFPLLAFHLQRHGTVAAAAIPLFYALANLVSAASAIGNGKALDRFGAIVVPVAFVAGALSTPLVLLGGVAGAVVGMALWGLAAVAAGSLLKPLVAHFVPADKRGSAFGAFDALYGVSWFLGSALLGVLYDRSVALAAATASALVLLGLPFLLAGALARRATPPL